MCRFDRMVTAREWRCAATARRGVIRASRPEGLGGALRPHSGATAGMSVHGPMT
jgi:hypothetical protein